MKLSLLVSLLVFVPPAPMMEGSAGPGGLLQVISFHLESPAAAVPDYTVDINENGTGKYWEGVAPEDGAPQKRVTVLTITAPTVAKIFAAKPLIGARGCETHLKNIAQTGKKKLTYYDNDQVSECVFNYSDDDKINDVAATFQAIALTIQAGDKLKQQHRFDHLGLDAELDSLLGSAKEGRAIELQNIAGILKSIVEDDEIMSPSRRKAKSLLELGGVHVEPGG